MSATPVLFQGRLFVQLIHGDGKAETQEAMVVAVDSLTGEALWATKRVTGATRENEHSYASPILYNFGDTPYLITHGADYTVAYSLEDGKERWRLGGLNPQGRAIIPRCVLCHPPPLLTGLWFALPLKMVQCSQSRQMRMAILRIATRFCGCVMTIRQMCLHPSYMVTSFICVAKMECCSSLIKRRAKRCIWKRTHSHRHRASPVFADGHLYLTARDGKVSVVKAGRDFEIVAQNDMVKPQQHPQ